MQANGEILLRLLYELVRSRILSVKWRRVNSKNMTLTQNLLIQNL